MRFSTGIPLLDVCLGGGMPVGLSLIHGRENTGKSCLAINILKEIDHSQVTAYIDLDLGADPEFLGDRLKNCIYVTPYCGEAAFETACKCIKNGVKIVCIDSLNNLIPLVEINKNVGDREVLAQKRLISHGCSELFKLCNKYKSAVLLISQVRVNPTEVRPKAKSPYLGFLPNVGAVLLLQKVKSQSSYGYLDFSIVNIKVQKLLSHPPLGETEVHLWNGKGFNKYYEFLKALIQYDLVNKKGNYFCMKGSTNITLGPGHAKASEQLEKHYDEILKLYINKITSG